MEKIIQKAIEGGYKDLLSFVSENQFWVVCNTKKTTFIENEESERYGDTKEVSITWGERKEVIVLDPLFWQALGKACRWDILGIGQPFNMGGDWYEEEWHIHYAIKFHLINLTEGWDKAVAYLEELVK